MEIYGQFGDKRVLYNPVNTNKKFVIKDINLTVPNDGGRYGRVKHDFELAEYGFKPRQLETGINVKYPIPQNRRTRPMYNGRVYDYVNVPEEHQWFLWELFKFALEYRVPDGKIEDKTWVKMIKGYPVVFNTYTPGSITEAYGSMIERSRDFTDAKAVEDGFADYPTNRNMGKPPWNWRCISHGGNLVKIIGEYGNYYIIEAIDLLKPPPKVEDVFYKHYLIQWATEITTVELPQLNGKRRWVVSSFPQIKNACRQNGLPDMGTPFPLWSLGGENRILKEFVIPLKNGDNFSPYVPEK
jgi:hypothetical protein